MVPPELREYILCHYVYGGISPEELDRQDQNRVQAHWICWQQDQIAQGMKAGKWTSKREIEKKVKG